MGNPLKVRLPPSQALRDLKAQVLGRLAC
jgi:hypothetical protein